MANGGPDLVRPSIELASYQAFDGARRYFLVNAFLFQEVIE
jgi:hypothetical protein